MKKLLVFLWTVTFVLGVVGSAGAIPYTDTYDAGGRLMKAFSGQDSSVFWTFDITDDGFNPDTQDVTSASVALNLRDDGGWFDFWEIASLDVGSNDFIWEVDSGDISFTITSLMTLSETGTVDATLTAIWGDFYFNSATLTAEGTSAGGTDPAVPVPEPATMFLMGVGLLAIGNLGTRIKKS